MRHTFVRNAALLAASDLALRLAGMALRIWLAGALGAEGMGLYQLVLAVYSLFVTLAVSGVSAASTRLMAEELAAGPARARGMLARLLAAGAALGCGAMAAQWALAEPAARWWLGDARAAGALRAGAFGLPCMAVAAVLRGFFIARGRVGPGVASQLAEQAFRAGAAPPRAARRLWDILWPVEGGRCLSGALHTAENMLVPACLTVYLGQRSAAVAQYGVLKGMALPLVNFPFGLLGGVGVLLMPELARARMLGDTRRLQALLGRMLRLTGYISALAGAGFWVWGRPLAMALYGSAEAGAYLEVLAPALPLLCLEGMVDAAMKGVGLQKAAFRTGGWDSALRIAAVALLLPRWGMRGQLAVILLSSLFTCAANTGRLLAAAQLRPDAGGYLVRPAAAALAAGLAGWRLRGLLGPWLAGGRGMQLAALAAGGAGMCAAWLLAAWPLGLGRELRAGGRKWESSGHRAKN